MRPDTVTKPDGHMSPLLDCRVESQLHAQVRGQDAEKPHD